MCRFYLLILVVCCSSVVHAQSQLPPDPENSHIRLDIGLKNGLVGLDWDLENKTELGIRFRFSVSQFIFIGFRPSLSVLTGSFEDDHVGWSWHVEASIGLRSFDDKFVFSLGVKSHSGRNSKNQISSTGIVFPLNLDWRPSDSIPLWLTFSIGLGPVKNILVDDRQLYYEGAFGVDVKFNLL